MNAHEPLSTQNDDLADLLGDIERLETIFAGWEETQRNAAQAYAGAIEALNGEALKRLVGALKNDPAARAAMIAAAGDEIVYAVLRRHRIIKPSLAERVETALAGVRPMLASHGGDVELVKVEPPSIEVRFLGACDGCPASVLTFHAGVKKAVQDAVPEITEVRQAKGLGAAGAGGVRFISPFALAAKGGWRFAAELQDIPEGGLRAMELGGEKILLSRQGAVVACFQNACAHLGLPLDGGLVENGILTCPHHEFQYDLASGECLTAPEVQLQAHGVRVIDQRVEVRLSK